MLMLMLMAVVAMAGGNIRRAMVALVMDVAAAATQPRQIETVPRPKGVGKLWVPCRWIGFGQTTLILTPAARHCLLHVATGAPSSLLLRSSSSTGGREAWGVARRSSADKRLSRPMRLR